MLMDHRAIPLFRVLVGRCVVKSEVRIESQYFVVPQDADRICALTHCFLNSELNREIIDFTSHMYITYKIKLKIQN